MVFKFKKQRNKERYVSKNVLAFLLSLIWLVSYFAKPVEILASSVLPPQSQSQDLEDEKQGDLSFSAVTDATELESLATDQDTENTLDSTSESSESNNLDVTDSETDRPDDVSAVNRTDEDSEDEKGTERSIYPNEVRRHYKFMVDGEQVHEQYVRNDQKLEAYRAPSKDDYVFVGWRLPDSEFPESTPEEDKFIDFDKEILFGERDKADRDIELTAIYKKSLIATFWIKSEAVEGREATYIRYDSQKVGEEGKLVPESVLDPEVRNMKFSHWSLEVNGAPFDFETKLDKSIKLYAVFAPAFTYHFHSEGGSAIVPIYVKEGESLTTDQIPAPYKDGYSFVEWREEDTDVAFDFQQPATQDRDLYAVYEPNQVPYTIILHLERKETEKKPGFPDFYQAYTIKRTGEADSLPEVFTDESPEMHDAKEYGYTLATAHPSTGEKGPVPLAEVFSVDSSLSDLNTPISPKGTSTYHVYLTYKPLKVNLIIPTFNPYRLISQFPIPYDLFYDIYVKHGGDPADLAGSKGRDIRPAPARIVPPDVEMEPIVLNLKRTTDLSPYFQAARESIIQKFTEEIKNALEKGEVNPVDLFPVSVFVDFPLRQRRIINRFIKSHPEVAYDLLSESSKLAANMRIEDFVREGNFYPVEPSVPEVGLGNNHERVIERKQYEAEAESYPLVLNPLASVNKVVYRYWILPESDGLDVNRDKQKILKLFDKYVAMPQDADLTQVGGQLILSSELNLKEDNVSLSGTDFVDIANYSALKNVGAYGALNYEFSKDQRTAYYNLFYVKTQYVLNFEPDKKLPEQLQAKLSSKLLYADADINSQLPESFVVGSTQFKDKQKRIWTFQGWYEDPNFSKDPVLPGGDTIKMPSSNKTLYAKWSLPDVTLRIHKGTTVNSDVVYETKIPYGGHIGSDLLEHIKTFSPTLIKPIPHLQQTGWKEFIGRTSFSFDPQIAFFRDYDIYPRYDKNYVSVYVRENANGKKVKYDDVAIGSTYSMPRYVNALKALGISEPKKGYYFDGWRIVEPEELFDSSKMYLTFEKTEELYRDITLEPVLREIKPADTFYVLDDNYENGSVQETKSVKHNERIDLATYQPKREGFVLVGWNTERSLSATSTPYRVVDKILVDDLNSSVENYLYAMWGKVSLEKSVYKVTDANDQLRQEIKVKEVGDKVYYRFIVQNQGNVPLSYPHLTDMMLGLEDKELSAQDLLAGNLDEIPVGGTAQYDLNAPYVVKEADLSKTKLDNTATIEFETPFGDSPKVTDNGSSSIPIEGKPSISLVKKVLSIESKTGEKYSDLTKAKQIGDKIHYGMSVKNTGPVDVSKLVITDALLHINSLTVDLSTNPLKPQENRDIALPPEGVTETDIYRFHTVTAAEVEAGHVDNSVTVTPYAPNNRPGQPVTPPEVVVTIDPNPNATFTKSIEKVESAKGTVYSDGEDVHVHEYGDKIYYSFTLTNTGNLPMLTAKLTDDLLGLDVQLDTDSATKDAFPLQPEATVTYQATAKPYTVQQSDYDKSEIVNTAKLAATFTGDRPLTLTDTKRVPMRIEGTPSFDVVKEVAKVTDAEGTERSDKVIKAIGDKVYYRFVVRNTGNLDISSVKITDDLLGYKDKVIKITIPVGQSATIEEQVNTPYLVKSSDFDNDDVVNTADVTVTTPPGDLTPKQPSTRTKIQKNPSSKLDKYVVKVTDPQGNERSEPVLQEVGDRVYYGFLLTNTGNVRFTEFKLFDPLLKLEETFTKPETEQNRYFEPGESFRIQRDTDFYTATEADVLKPVLVNTSEVEIPFIGVPKLPRIPSNNTDTPSKFVPNLDFSVNKVVDHIEAADGNRYQDETPTFHAVGDKVFYALEMKNLGNTTIDSLKIEDALLNLEVVLSQTIAPQGSYRYLIEDKPLLVTQAMLDANLAIDNTAYVTPHFPSGDGKRTPSTKRIVPDVHPSVRLTKEVSKLTNASDEEIDAPITTIGDKIYYRLKVENTGNNSITAFTLRDPLLNFEQSFQQTLAPGASFTYEVPVPYVVQQSDLTLTEKYNEASVTAKHPGGHKDSTDKDNAKVPLKIKPNPNFSLEKELDRITDANDNPYVGLESTEVHAIGDKVYWCLKIVNTGDVNISSIYVQDSLLDVDTKVQLDAPIQPGQSYIYRLDTPHVVTAEDFAQLHDQQAYDWIDNTVRVTSSFRPPKPVLPGEPTEPGQPVEPGEPDQPDEPSLIPDIPHEAEHKVPIRKTPDFSIQKEISKVVAADGMEREDHAMHAFTDKVYYRFTLKNLGNQPLQSVQLDDQNLGISETINFEKPLFRGESFVYDAETPYTTDWDAVLHKNRPLYLDEFTNTVTAIPTTTDGKTLPPKDSSTTVKITEPVQPSIQLEKRVSKIEHENGEVYFEASSSLLNENATSDEERITAVGDRIYYEFIITNTGNVPLINIKLNDPKLGITDLDTDYLELAPGERVSFSVQVPYVVQASDAELQDLQNIATVTGYLPPKPEGSSPDVPNDPNGYIPNKPVTGEGEHRTPIAIPKKPTPTEPGTKNPTSEQPHIPMTGETHENAFLVMAIILGAVMFLLRKRISSKA